MLSIPLPKQNLIVISYSCAIDEEEWMNEREKLTKK